MRVNHPVGTSEAILDNLQRLIEAIDRRVPQPERPKEAAIARDAAVLRDKAVSLMRVMATDSNATATDDLQSP